MERKLMLIWALANPDLPESETILKSYDKETVKLSVIEFIGKCGQTIDKLEKPHSRPKLTLLKRPRR